MSNSEKAPPPTAAGKLGLSYVFTKVLFTALGRLCTSPFKGQKGAPTYFRDVAYAAVRTQLRGMTISQSRYLTPSTTDSYHQAAKALAFAPESIDLPNGVQAHWIGDKNAEITLVYFHGGGYVQPAGLNHYTYIHDLVATLSSNSGPKVSALLLAYTLAPDAEFPTQLSEAATLIKYLLKTLSRSPSSLILAGDSAGGNLVLSLLSHILHPHPKAVGKVPVVDVKEPFKAIFVLSPWVSFSTDHPSFEYNSETDVFDATPLKLWASAFLGSTQRHGILMGDSYSEPLLAEPTWWSGAHKVVSEVLIWGGGGEVFIDGIRTFGEKFVEGWVCGGGDSGKVTQLESPKMAHEEMLLDLILGYKEKGVGAIGVENWVKSKL